MSWWRTTSRGDEILEEIRELRKRDEKRELERSKRFDRLMQENRDEIRITREVIRRNEVAFQDSRRELERVGRALDENVDELRAQRGALLSLIDEMRGGGPSPAT